MNTTNIIYKKIKRGYITKLVKTKQLREDIPCYITSCTLCEKNQEQLTIERPIIFLNCEAILSQIDALENFSIINNVIIPQSEYSLLRESNEKTFKRLNILMENRTIVIYPNEYHNEIALIPNEGEYTKSQKKKILFNKTITYISNHIKVFANTDYSIIVIRGKDNYDIEQNEELRIRCYDLLQYAKSEIKDSPDLFNYVAHYESSLVSDHQQMEIDTGNKTTSTGEKYTNHYSDSEMKANIKLGLMFQGKIFFQPGIDSNALIKCQLFEKEIIVNGYHDLNRAMNGDIVCFTFNEEEKWTNTPISSLNQQEGGVVEEEDENNQDQIDQTEDNNVNVKNIQEKVNQTKKQPTAHIEGILRRFRIVFSGTINNPTNPSANTIDQSLIKNIDNDACVFIPIDSKYPCFFIKLNQRDQYYNQRIIIQFDTWTSDSPLPNGHFIKKLGPCLDIKVENDIILYEHSVDINPFSQKIIDSMPREDTEFKCPPEELQKRLDLRNICVCSIDPPGCKDIDDALHCRLLPNGNYEVGVHIADVTHYVKPGSDVDKIAAKNCNTIYLVHKRTDMLPKVLTENLCSLVGMKERLAFSVLWEMTPDTIEVINVKYAKSVIKSKASLTYENANNIMNDKSDDSELANGIRYLNKIAKTLKQRRIRAGALILASNEMKFNINQETNTVNDISMYQTFETNSLVEEFMLFANVYVAKKIYESYPSCSILRRHPPPKEKELNALIRILNERGYQIDKSTSLSLGHSLDQIEKPSDPFFNRLVRSLLTRTMNQAKYFCSSEFSYEEFFHYGLAMEIYTHFTSPIRRYSDILVHRLLAAAIEIDYLPIDMSNKVKADRECNQMNKQNRVGFFCGKDSNYFSAFLFFNEYNMKTENKGKPIEVEIVIHSIDTNFIKGMSIKYGIEANIDFSKVGGIDNVDYVKRKVQLKNKSNDEISLFDHVNVEIVTSFFNYRYEIKYFYLRKTKASY